MTRQLRDTLRLISRYLLIAIIGFTFLAMFTYIYDLISSKPTSLVTLPGDQAIAKAGLTSTVAQPTPTPAISDYRMILLLVRATDLMVKYVDQVKAGEIDPGDASVRTSYLQAFPIAIDAYNRAIPTTGMEHGWKNVTMVAQAYNLVYPILQQGNMVSDNDLFSMKSSRQWLANYRDTEESVLTSRGIGPDFFVAEKQAVEQVLQENYGSMVIPSAGP